MYRTKESRPDIPSISFHSYATKEFEPDLCRVLITFEGKLPTAEECVKAFEGSMSRCCEKLSGIGIEPDRIEGGELDITPVEKRLYRKTDSDYYQQIPYDVFELELLSDGYRFRSHAHFDMDLTEGMERIEEAWRTLSKCDGISFDFRYFIRNRDQAENELIEIAVSEARSQAEMFAHAAGCKLGRVLRIDADGEVRARGGARCARELSDDESYVPLIKPHKISVDRSADIEWELIQDE